MASVSQGMIVSNGVKRRNRSRQADRAITPGGAGILARAWRQWSLIVEQAINFALVVSIETCMERDTTN